MVETEDLVRQRQKHQFWSKVMYGSLAVATVGALVFGAVNYAQGQSRQEAIDKLGRAYDTVRTDKADLCDQKVNATKPECLQPEAPPAREIVRETVEKAIPIPGIRGPRGFPGPQGRSVSMSAVRALVDDQVASAFQRCIATGQCVGPAGTNGADGTNGTNGADGRGIESLACQKSGLRPQTIIVNYTDGTTQTVECQMMPLVGG